MVYFEASRQSRCVAVSFPPFHFPPFHYPRPDFHRACRFSGKPRRAKRPPVPRPGLNSRNISDVPRLASIKFTPKVGIIRVTLMRDQSSSQIEVSDNGQGISPGLLPYVFDRFRQGDSSSRR
jgi:hypothetical protein